MSKETTFLTIAGRYKAASQASGIDKLPRHEQGLCMMMFYAGFSASLEAGLELAELPEDEAVQIMGALHNEVQQVQAMAAHLISGRVPS